MADFSTEYQGILVSSREFLNKVNELTKEGEDRLTNLREIQKILTGIVEGEPESEQISQKRMDISRELCKILLFGDWLVFITAVAGKSHFVSEVENQQSADKSSKLPERMQVKVDEISYYVKQCEVIMKKIDNIMVRLIVKVREAKVKNFKIEDEQLTSLQMDIDDVKCELEKCKKCLGTADEVFSQLKSDIEAESWHHKIRVAAIGTAAVATILIGGVTLSMSGSICNSAQTFHQHLVVLLFGPAVVTGAAAFLVWKNWSTVRKYFPKSHFILQEKRYWKLLTTFHYHSQLMQERDRITLRLKKLREKVVLISDSDFKKSLFPLVQNNR